MLFFVLISGLWPLSKGYSDAYMDTFDPRITNEFAAAAFRFGHSLIPDVFKRVPQSGTVGGQQGRTAALSMKDVFFKPDALRTNGGELFLRYVTALACRVCLLAAAYYGCVCSGRGRKDSRKTETKPSSSLPPFTSAMFDELVRGMASQEGELWDNAFVSSIRDHLFESTTDKGGLGKAPYKI